VQPQWQWLARDLVEVLAHQFADVPELSLVDWHVASLQNLIRTSKTLAWFRIFCQKCDIDVFAPDYG